jgi:two-component system, OmpR family, response regulator
VKILLIEDDKETSAHIVYALGKEGHEVDLCHDGSEGLERARAGGHGALIVDRMLPGLDGLSLVRRMREDGSQTPVLILTTMSGLDDRVEGLQAGADDYLVKPFAFPELLARVHAITRRSQRAGESEPVRLRAGDLEIDLIRRTVQRGGRTIELQAQEFRLLEFLMRNAGRVVTRTMLLEKVWDLHFDPRQGGSRFWRRTDPHGARRGIHAACRLGSSAPKASVCRRSMPASFRFPSWP